MHFQTVVWECISALQEVCVIKSAWYEVVWFLFVFVVL